MTPKSKPTTPELAAELQTELDLPHEDAAQILKFVEKVGGVERAQETMAELEHLGMSPDAAIFPINQHEDN